MSDSFLLFIYLNKTSTVVLECKARIVCCSHWCSGLKILEGNLLTHPLVMKRFMTMKNLKALHLYLNFPILYNLIHNCVYPITGRWEVRNVAEAAIGEFFMHPVEAWWPHAVLLVKSGQVWHSECSLAPEPWTSWSVVILYVAYNNVCCMNFILIHQWCESAWRAGLYEKRWKSTDSNTTLTE